MDNTLTTIIIAAIVGFVAQIIDGSLGMGYKVSSSTFLLSLGIPPVLASASVHTGGIFTSAVSGFAHFRLGNVDRVLVQKLAIPGVIGGIIGAVILSHAPTQIVKPAVTVYLLVMGVIIIQKSFRHLEPAEGHTPVTVLGLMGGFFDAIGGGGWGPIVTSTLVARGHMPRLVIGSVNLAEFFVTVAQAMVFFTLLGTVHWPVVIGLVVGGVPAAPLAARIVHRIPARRLMVAVGILIILLSLRSLYLALFPA
jgi:uncharacterized protein